MRPVLRRTIVIPLIGLALAASACSSGGSDSANVCDAAKAFQGSVQKLSSMSVASDGVDAIKAQIQDAENKADALASVANDQLGSQAAAVKNAYAVMFQTIANAPNPAVAAQAITQGMANVKAQQAALQQDITSSCSSS